MVRQYLHSTTQPIGIKRNQVEKNLRLCLVISEVKVDVQLLNTHGLENLLGAMCHVSRICVRLQLQFERPDILFRAQRPKVGLLFPKISTR